MINDNATLQDQINYLVTRRAPIPTFRMARFEIHELRIVLAREPVYGSVEFRRFARTCAAVRYRPHNRWQHFGDSYQIDYMEKRSELSSEELAFASLLHFLIHEAAEQFQFENPQLAEVFDPHESEGTARIQRVLAALAHDFNGDRRS